MGRQVLYKVSWGAEFSRLEISRVIFGGISSPGFGMSPGIGGRFFKIQK